MGKIYAIARNAFTETVRQPFFIIILGIAAFFIATSPAFTMFTLMNNVKLLKDMGLATILLTGLLQAAFSAGQVVSNEVESKAIITVLAKPVSKAQFVIGKFAGIAAALIGSAYLLTLILVFTVRIGVPEAAYSRLHRPVIFGELFAFGFAIILAVLGNYFSDRSFSNLCFGYSVLSFTFVFIVLGFVSKDLSFQSFCADVDPNIIKAGYLLIVALLSITAVAVALSTRLGFVITIGFCIFVFLLGLLSDYIFERLSNFAGKVLYAVIPNMQVFWIADAVGVGKAIPSAYVWNATLYGVFFQSAVLLLSIILFEGRESV